MRQRVSIRARGLFRAIRRSRNLRF